MSNLERILYSVVVACLLVAIVSIHQSNAALVQQTTPAGVAKENAP